MSKDKPKVTPKDFFLHLLAMVTLYASAIAFTVIAFQSVNIWIPDALSGYYEGQGARSMIRGSLAFLIVAFPVYLFTAWSLAKSYRKDKSKRKIWVRKWLVYFTLFVAALIIIGSLIALVAALINGELTLRFVLKFLSVVFVTGSIFGYYLWDEKYYEQQKQHTGLTVFVSLVVLVVLAAVVVGFIHGGSPAEQRDRRLDDRRETDLSQIEYELISQYEREEVFPENLDRIQSVLGDRSRLVDPVTGERYEYNRLSESSYELCAIFAQDTTMSDEPVYRDYRNFIIAEQSFAEHAAGRVCFERSVDLDEFARYKEQTRPQPIDRMPPIAY